MDDRYGGNNSNRTAKLVIGLPIALAMFVIGGLLTLRSWGVLDGPEPSSFVAAVAPALAGLGVALAWVLFRPAQH